MTRTRRDHETFKITAADLQREAGNGTGSLVDQIFATVAAAIQARRIVAGIRMPSVRQLASDCDISRDTAARAYDKLVAQGLLEPRRGAGFYVRARGAKAGTDGPVPRAPAFYSHTVDRAFRFKMTLIDPPSDLKTRSGTGYLPGSWMDEGEIGTALRAIARTQAIDLGSPGNSQGYRPLREQIDLKLRDLGIHADPANIVITSGATEALSLVALRMLTAGEVVLIERPVQPLLIDRLLASGIEFANVPRLPDGPDLAELRAMCEKHRPKLFFCNSVLHNPTSRNIAPHVAFQLLRLAEEFDLTIVEDDAYGDLLPPNVPVTRLASLDQLHRVIYVGSFSKTLPPSLRVGFIAAHPSFVEWFAVYRALTCISTNVIAERVVHRLLSEGNYRHHCEQLRTRLAELRPRAIRALQDAGVEIDHDPDAGLFVWGRLSSPDASAVAAKMLERGHLTAPGSLFSHTHPAHMRFNIAETLYTDFLPEFRRTMEEMRNRG